MLLLFLSLQVNGIARPQTNRMNRTFGMPCYPEAMKFGRLSLVSFLFLLAPVLVTAQSPWVIKLDKDIHFCARTGKVLWRYKGADEGVTNLLFAESNTIAVADRDDLILLDATNGKRRMRVPHRIEHPSFGLLNERGNVLIGGQSEIVAFDPVSGSIRHIN
jgi:hypothetical protein